MEPDLSAKKATNKPAGGEEKQQEQKQVTPPDVNNITHPDAGWDNLFKLVGAIGIATWMIQEWIIPHNQIFLFITIVCFVADVFYIIADRKSTRLNSSH